MKLGLLCGGYALVSTNSPGKFFFSTFYQLARTSTLFTNVTHAFVLFCASSAQLQLSTTESLLPCMCLLLEFPHLPAYASCDICWQLWFIAFPWCTYACSLLAFELNVSCTFFFFFLASFTSVYIDIWVKTPGVLSRASLLSFWWSGRRAGHVADVPVGSDVAWWKKQLRGPVPLMDRLQAMLQ